MMAFSRSRERRSRRLSSVPLLLGSSTLTATSLSLNSRLSARRSEENEMVSSTAKVFFSLSLMGLPVGGVEDRSAPSDLFVARPTLMISTSGMRHACITSMNLHRGKEGGAIRTVWFRECAWIGRCRTS